MDNNPPPPYYSGSFNNLNDKTTKEGNPIFTAPPYPPPHSQSYIIGVGSLLVLFGIIKNIYLYRPLNSNGIPPQPPPPINVNRPIHVYTPKFGPYPLEMDWYVYLIFIVLIVL